MIAAIMYFERYLSRKTMLTVVLYKNNGKEICCGFSTEYNQ